MIISKKKKGRNLVKLYEQIHSCARCTISEDISKVIRIIDEQALTSKIFLVGQALGGNTQRISGIPYTKIDGKLSPTGQRLNEFLHLFGYTISHQDRSSLFKYAYSSDIVQCYPGKIKPSHADRKPNNAEILNCIDYLLKEIKLIEPKLILLMGKESRDCFYKYVLKQLFPNSLSIHIYDIMQRGQIPQFKVLGKDLFIIPTHHPSGANPHFNEMTSNHKLIALIREVLQ